VRCTEHQQGSKAGARSCCNDKAKGQSHISLDGLRGGNKKGVESVAPSDILSSKMLHTQQDPHHLRTAYNSEVNLTAKNARRAADRSTSAWG
jgi:hypothetical protein